MPMQKNPIWAWLLEAQATAAARRQQRFQLCHSNFHFVAACQKLYTPRFLFHFASNERN